MRNIFAKDMSYFGQDLFNAFCKMGSGEDLKDVDQHIIAENKRQKMP
jgi:FMN-dependent NADH-azoreductase